MSSSNNYQDLPLPYGWIEQYHEGHRYYVDTKANPPRSIWVHPYEDEQYLREHPDVREKVRPSSSQGLNSKKPSYNDEERTRRHSYNGESSRAPKGAKRGFFGKLKDKAIGTKEEREAEKVRMAQLQEQRRQQRLAQQQAYYSQAQYAPPPQQYGNRYGGYGGGYGYGSGMGGMGGMGGRRTGGMGGMALPLIGGMAGGLLLGEALDDFGGGGFGNGGFDNGGFDGGGFDGGGFDNMGGGFF
ncbi:hypothetical protein C8R42DRAFT_667804 [Lentinula raphanica]|nr:hypothetical protein C8R42DRAFT_667804 [Lentinula raphanica]